MNIKDILVGISLADHMGDVNDYLPMLAKELALPAPKWSDRYSRYIWEWEVEGVEICGDDKCKGPLDDQGVCKTCGYDW